MFLDSLDALHVLGKDVRASTAAHNSARFTYVSPAGDLGNRNGSVIDGGYFENYGALTALELARAAKEALKDEGPAIKLVFLLISSDPGLDEKRTLVRINERKGGEKCLVSVAEREGASSTTALQTISRSILTSSRTRGSTSLSRIPGGDEGARGAWKSRRGRARRPNLHGISSSAKGRDSSDADRRRARHGKGCRHRQFRTPRGEAQRSVFRASGDVQGRADTASACWVLSKSTVHFHELLKTCGNDVQLRELEIALGKEAQQSAAR